MIADEVLEQLSRAKLFITREGDITFYLRDVEVALMTKGLIAQWVSDRKGFGPWVQQGAVWYHKHPDGIRFYHNTRGCELLS